MLRPLTIIGCLTVAGTVCAEPVPLTDETIESTLAGSLLEMDTPLGTKIPVRFTKNGLVSGEAGILAGMLGAEKDRGRWWTKNDQLCVKWFRWFEAKPKCASLRQDGSRIYWRERGGESGTATLAERAEPAAPKKVAKVVEPKPQPKPEPPQQVEAQVENKIETVTASQPAAPDNAQAAATTGAPSEALARSQALASSQPEAKTALPIQQVAAADTQITQRAAKPLNESTPPLMFAGMAGLQGISMLNTQDSEPAPSEKPAQVAALAEPTDQPGTEAAAPAQPPLIPQPKSSAADASASATATSDAQDRIVDIDAMGTTGMGTSGMRSSRTVTTGPAVRDVSFRVTGVRADDVLNVRSGPSEYHQPVGRIPPAARGVRIVGSCRGEWCPIRRGRVSGWVNSYYLAEETAVSRSRR